MRAHQQSATEFRLEISSEASEQVGSLPDDLFERLKQRLLGIVELAQTAPLPSWVPQDGLALLLDRYVARFRIELPTKTVVVEAIEQVAANDSQERPPTG